MAYRTRKSKSKSRSRSRLRGGTRRRRLRSKSRSRSRLRGGTRRRRSRRAGDPPITRSQTQTQTRAVYPDPGRGFPDRFAHSGPTMPSRSGKSMRWPH